jgi:hypothetical protein
MYQKFLFTLIINIMLTIPYAPYAKGEVYSPTISEYNNINLNKPDFSDLPPLDTNGG